MPNRNRLTKYVGYVAGFLAVVLVAVSVVSVVTVRRAFPDTTGSVQVPGMTGEVEVVRDENGIPQLYADSSTDLFVAQGYVQAQDRFFEMDFRRHVTSGRLAELFGKSALETDKFVRTLGWRRVAEQEVAKLDQQTQRRLRAYARGVNAYIQGRSNGELSLEYAVLGLTGPNYAPAEWTSADSVAWLKAMAWDLRSNMSDEIARVLSTDKLNRDQVDQLYPAFPYDRNDPIVKSAGRGTGKARPAPSAADAKTSEGTPTPEAIEALSQVGSAADALPALLGTGDGIGSNSWVVSGQRSTTGKPILANDPHLEPSMPGIWYQMGLHCRKKSQACPFDVSGFTFSGVPGVVIGHNDKISWGFTTMYPDVTDLYLEKVAGRFYEYDGKKLPVVSRKETFEVAGQDERESITVRSTRHGPILSDLDDDIAEVGGRADPAASYEVSLQWTALRPGRTMDALFAFNTATSWDEFRGAAKSFEVPSQNLVYADVDGHIGYQAPGLVPRRPAEIDGKPGDGRWPVPGWDPKYDWKGYIPFDELPTVLDPEEGYIVTANQEVIGPEYKYLLGAGAAAGYRSKRIADMIESKPKLDVADMTRMQMDSRSSNAAMLVPRLLQIDVGSSYFGEAQDLLRDWDYKQEADSGAAAYFNAVWRNLLALTFHDNLPEPVWPDGGERWFEVMRQIIDNPASSWWDDARTKDRRESRDEILLRAMRDGRDEMTARQARDVSRWRWGNIHRLTLTNPTLGTSGIGPIEAMFNRGPYEVAGGGGIVDATGWDARAGYEVNAVPSMRMVVDMDDLDRSRWIQLSGQSGHAYSGNYVDQAQLWAEGKTLPWAFTRKAVDERETHTLRLASNLAD